MLKPQRQSNRSQHSITKSVAAPFGGWNARDPIAEMEPQYAAIMDNWMPRTGDLITRRGSVDYATGLPGQVNSLMVYAGTTSSKMFAGSNSGAANSGAIYEVTSTGAVGAASVSSLASDKFQYINVSTSGGKYLWAVNGSDLAQMYDGTTWTNPAITGLTAGLTTADLSHVNLWGNRIILTQKNSLSIWYLPLNSISGAASQIDFGPLFTKGGRIVLTANWTIDGGTGVDDALIIFTSQGEVAVYRGGDPSTAAGFVKSGVYSLGSPVGTRCYVKYGGDAVLITMDGFEPLSASLTSTRTNNKIAISDKISGAVTQATTDYQNNFGWEATLYPTENMLLFNVPVTEGSENHQYVMNTLTGAWTRFKGWNANCFAILNDQLYFGTNGKVCMAWVGTADSGVAISTDVQTAFSYFDQPGRGKQWKMARPVFTAQSKPVMTFGINVDFSDVDVPNSISFSGPNLTWDNALWNSGTWAGNIIYKDWQTVTGIGYAAALRMKSTSTSLDCRWASVDYVFEYCGTIV